MSEGEFEKVRLQIEAKSGPLSPSDEIECKGLYYFGKGIKLKNQLENESQHISEILPVVMADIERRMKTDREQQLQRRIEAFSDGVLKHG